MQYLENVKLRKEEHIKYANESYACEDYFKEVIILNNSLPEVNYDEISLKTKFLGENIDMPLMINAMTGGANLSFDINRDLSIIAKEFNIPIAVGSQSIMIKDKIFEDSFKIVRKNNKDGIIISNLSAMSSLDDVKRATDSLEANAIQLHLNVSQELVMTEGDRNFNGMLKNIEDIIKNINVPVIIKEVGSGISFDVCKKLNDIGVKYVDVGGKGGTSFIKIESLRKDSDICRELMQLEIPTPQSILFCRAVSDELNIISSGGINNSINLIKSLILGANMVGMSGAVLKVYLEGGIIKVRDYINNIKNNSKIFMGCLGCKEINDLKNIKYYYEKQNIVNHFINN
ncbi:type 2 isopentenyl-diphosphate Delta-isomerase [Clostridium sp. Ade.TY]|uniref:type 2 isopentenyl-diphosphate Delta-isomerase n=1 Tax=Clostridium sp. Ade.TY TaxID=1391647 RepID=UPI00040FFD74|nr:type 2 isopentenyl-diphosphate Delta-isomerase [Clostridium sp. Ade.TY]